MKIEEEFGLGLGGSAGRIRHLIFQRTASKSFHAQVHVILIIENMKAASKYRLKAYQIKLDDFLQLKSPEKLSFNALKLTAMSKVNINFKLKKDISNHLIKSYWQSKSQLLMISLQPNMEEMINEELGNYNTAHLLFVSLKEPSK